jgi:glycosyltransferase involved in cell wall biosynthesis
MKILIVSQYFWPEEFRINDLAIDLVNRGHDISVLTGIPNYPKGSYFKGYRFRYSIEYYQGIRVYRVPIIPRGNNSFMLIINYFSYFLSASVFALFHKKQYDKVIAVNFSPITAVYPAIVYKIRHRVKLFLWVQDLWPESVTASGKHYPAIVMNVLTKFVRYIYKNSDKVMVQSEAFGPSVTEKGVTETQLMYLPNWAEDLYSNSENVNHGKYKTFLPEGFKVMFAGNIGEAQDFDSIIKAANITRDIPEIKWIIIGDGRNRKWAENEISRHKLRETVIMLGRYPVSEMPDFFTHADLMLLSLKDEKIFALTIPTKVQSYMAFGKPVVGMLNGIGAKLIKDADCGFVCNASDYKTLADNIIKAYHHEPANLAEKGLNGKAYYNQFFSKKRVIDTLIGALEE